MPTNSEILSLAPGASYLANMDIQRSPLFNNQSRLNPLLPQQIYALFFVINKIHSIDPEYTGLTAACNYLWEIMGRYGVQAQGLSGGGGNVPSPTPVINFPIYITNSDFTTETLYPNDRLLGNNIIVYYNEAQRYLIPGTEFYVNAVGLNITLAGFDALQFECNLVIEKYYN